MISIGFFEVFSAVIGYVLLCFLWNSNNGKPLNWPILGMLPGLLLHIHNIHDRCANLLGQSGGTFLFKGPWFTNMDMLNTVDPANVHYVMSSNFTNFPKSPNFMKIFDVLGDWIFNSDDDMWKNQRKLARVLINHQRFHRYLDKTSRGKVEQGLIPVLENVFKKDMIVDLQDLFQRFTFDTSCILVTGYDPGCLSIDLPDVPFAKAMDDAEEAILMRHVVPPTVWKLQSWLGLGHEKKMSKAWETLDRVINKYVLMKRNEVNKQAEVKEEASDLLTSYMVEDESMGLERDDKFLRDTILNLMIAGRDTTSSALTWFFWLVSQNPIVKDRIREELLSAIPLEESQKWRIFKVEELKNLVYLHGAICEALRLFPPVPFQHKEAVEPDILPSGHHIHPKMKILFSLYAMGRMKFVWGEDCEEFKPERWISERGTIKHEPSYKFFSFNAGPRTCLGKEVAFNQIKTVAAAIIHNYNVEVVKGHPVVPNASIILYMKHGFKVRVAKRWS